MPLACGALLVMALLVAPVQASRPNLAPLAKVHTLQPIEVQRTVTLARGETLASALREAGWPKETIQTLVKASPLAKQPVANRTALTLRYTEQAPYTPHTATLTFRPKPTEELTLSLLADGRVASSLANKPLRSLQATAVGTITESLWQDATAAGLPSQLVKPFMDLFAWDLDYTRDLHPGDRFQILFEETQNDQGERVKTGRILAAAFTVNGETRHAFWFNGEYLDEKGTSKRKLLLRTPLEVFRISSGFGRREHPVLGYTRMHRGTDFAAPSGTPIKASGNGTVKEAGVRGGYGNFLHIQHNATYSTAYGHILRFAKGIRPGSKVKQGQIVAYVGSTGVSTGPHLHYEVRKHGQQINPMSADLPTSNPLSKTQLAQFKRFVTDTRTAWARAAGNRQLASR
jgi:murein DD-endopeptidase MepM/ murein hydrolase activator NlpD